MKTEELYHSIHNPLDENDFINHVLEAYLNNSDFYSGLIQTRGKQKKDSKNHFYYQMRDAFYLFLFQEWKSGLEYYLTHSVNNKKRESEAKALYHYVSHLEPTSYQDVQNILDGKNAPNSYISELLFKYRWDRIYGGSSFTHIDSSYLYARTHKRNPIEHRLYANCDCDIIYFVALEFMKRCKSRMLKFYFKFDDFSDRDDFFVIYSNTKDLAQYYEILEEIREEYGLDQYLYEPPLLTGKINQWIGYGTEPNIIGDKYSYSNLREAHLIRCIQKETISWIKSNPNAQVKIGEKSIPYYDYFVSCFVREVRKLFINKSNWNCNYHLNGSDLYSTDFKKEILHIIQEHFRDILSHFSGESIFHDIDISFKGETISFTVDDLEQFLKTQVSLLYHCYPPFKDHVKKRIQDSSEGFGFSSNYSIDIHAIRQFDEEIQREKKDSLSEQLKHQEKVYSKRREWTPMTDKDILLSRKKLGLE